MKTMSCILNVKIRIQCFLFLLKRYTFRLYVFVGNFNTHDCITVFFLICSLGNLDEIQKCITAFICTNEWKHVLRGL